MKMSSVSIGAVNTTIVYLLPISIIARIFSMNKDLIIFPYRFNDFMNSICERQVKKPLAKNKDHKDGKTERLKSHIRELQPLHARACR